MKMIDLITKKKKGEEHSFDEINFIINGVNAGLIPDYQISAWLMAVYFKGMTFQESAILTEAMAKSGDILDLSPIGEYVIDKHSTGGVGDKITLILIPLLAASGLTVAKLSGKGLGHTGGTIDKLESMPGFKTNLDMNDFLSQIKTVGGAIVGQTSQLTPADGKLYALRDVTSTVDCLPLIASSILSKKIASGANIIILDVKYGSGAFVKTVEEAEELARIMVEIGKKLNKSITAVITSMEQPLGKAVGNSLEVIESIETLKNNGPEDVIELTLELGAVALVKAKKCLSKKEAKESLKALLVNGKALKKFKEIVEAQGGDKSSIDNTEKLRQAAFIKEFKANKSGYINKLCAFNIAKACKIMGAGRDKKEDKIDYSVGVLLNKKIGDNVKEGDVLAQLYGNSEELILQALDLLPHAYEISDSLPQKQNLIYKIID